MPVAAGHMPDYAIGPSHAIGPGLHQLGVNDLHRSVSRLEHSPTRVDVGRRGREPLCGDTVECGAGVVDLSLQIGKISPQDFRRLGGALAG